MRNIIKSVLIGTLLSVVFLLAKDSKVAENSEYHSTLININQWQYWQRSDGLSACDPHTEEAGGIFPRNTSNLIYKDGLIWGGYVQDPSLDKPQLRVNGLQFDSGMQSGNIVIPGTSPQPPQAADPANPKFRIYRVRKNLFTIHAGQLRNEAADYFNIIDSQVTESQMDTIRQLYLDDWQNWPADLGAPYYDRNRNGKWDADYDEPGIVDADQILWYVVNDLDDVKSDSVFFSPSIGLEVQVTLWAYNHLDGSLGKTIFKRYKMINHSGYHIKDMYFGIWSDPDIGDYSDDACGCDTLRQMAFAYNTLHSDYEFSTSGLAPPAVGYVLLQGPLIIKTDSTGLTDFKRIAGFDNQKMSSFTYYGAVSTPSYNPQSGYERTQAQYNLLRGYQPGTDLADPTSFIFRTGPQCGQATIFPLSGDPVTDPYGEFGDIDWAGSSMVYFDRRMQLNTGPFEMAPGDEQEIVFAIVGGLGEDRLASVKQLQDYAPVLHEFYQSLVDYEPPVGPVPGMEEEDILPDANAFVLGANYPNPFNSYTNIKIQLFDEMNIKIEVWNTLGQRIKTVFRGTKQKGEHTFHWNGNNELGVPAPSGMYLLRMQSVAQIQWRKMVYLK